MVTNRCEMLPAHPRRCGENEGAKTIAEEHSGSSPQVRGKHSTVRKNIQCQRLIPAGAGKTVRVLARSRGVPAHPRRCGENTLAMFPLCNNRGSSPQVRGKRLRHVLEFLKVRLIPAGAGETWTRPVIRDITPAHPRRCGENTPLSLGRNFTAGSSPQVRGKLKLFRFSRVRRRLIPAGAGKT